ncbi:hypothetical protein EDB82DRAFT_187387 [Fusarium venenatum]|uniref:uncharacterized protein n=1 Tax=Fusarium venenatum TaxID=56646 RepID=UPI001D5939E4|nr:hypothetical protein EDB82DRAFT_187387 [Fusarium venenatum]
MSSDVPLQVTVSVLSKCLVLGLVFPQFLPSPSGAVSSARHRQSKLSGLVHWLHPKIEAKVTITVQNFCLFR